MRNAFVIARTRNTEWRMCSYQQCLHKSKVKAKYQVTGHGIFRALRVIKVTVSLGQAYCYSSGNCNCKYIPISLCGDNIDRRDGNRRYPKPLYHRRTTNMEHCEISAAEHINIEAQFLMKGSQGVKATESCALSDFSWLKLFGRSQWQGLIL
jgi:hypothetical protein